MIAIRQNRRGRWTRHNKLIPILVLLLLVSPTPMRAKTDVWARMAVIGETVTALALASPGIVYAGTSSGAIFSIAARTQIRLVVADLGSRANPITVIAVDPTNSDRVYAATADGFFKSSDAGSTWTMVIGDIGGYFAIGIDPQDPEIVYAASRLGLIKSRDGGISWEQTSLTLPVENIVIDPHTPAIIYAATSIGVVKSTDKGANWMSYPWTREPVRGLAIDPLTPTTLYASGSDGGVFKSVNGGISWSYSGLNTRPVFSIVVDSQEPSTVYAATEDGPFKSVDGGVSWFPIFEGFSAPMTAMVGDLALCKVYVANRDIVFETDIGPVLTIHSNLCVGGEWTVVVSHAGGNRTIRLLGASNSTSWEVPDWGMTNDAGMFTASGTFAGYSEGTHELRVEVNGELSNTISFTVTNCVN